MFGRLCTSIFHRACSSRISSAPATSKLAAFLSNHTTQRGQFCRLSSWTNGADQMNYTSKQSQIPLLKTRSFSTRTDLDFPLIQLQMNSFLKSKEQSAKVHWWGPTAVRSFESNQVAVNTPNEDRRSTATCQQSAGTLFGVFDGHGGWACAQAVSERLLYYVAAAMMPKQILESFRRCIDMGLSVPPILDCYNHPTDYNYRESASHYDDQLQDFLEELSRHDQELSPSDALDLAFKRLDANISSDAQLPFSNNLAMKSTAIQVAFSGCTACVAHVGLDAIHVANSGNCRAVLGVREEDGSWSAQPLSRDHNSQNPSEVERIKAQHPQSERDTVVTDERLLRILTPLRAFGDVRFKWSLELQQSVISSLESTVDLGSLNLYNYVVPPNYLTPPYLDVTPEITYHKLRPQDRFIILATDGLWNKLSSEEAVQLVGQRLFGLPMQRQRSAPFLDNVTTDLIRQALCKGDNGELCQEKLATMLSLPEDLARMYRDDITVTVVYLNTDLIRTRVCKYVPPKDLRWFLLHFFPWFRLLSSYR